MEVGVDFEVWWLILIPIVFALGWIAARVDFRQMLSETRQLPDSYFKGLNFLLNEDHDKAIDALYAFTDCEVSISPNCCVINEDKPHFMTVSDLLRISVENTKELLHKELLIQKGEAQEILHFASLEKIF